MTPDAPVFPVFLKLGGRRVVVIGGGKMAASKLGGLLHSGASVTVVIPAYEQIVAARPQNAQAMVVLANAYWLTGRGGEVVGALALRAKTADARNRGAWHLWALSESTLRTRVDRWLEVARQFPQDQLARAALADNAASLAASDDDPAALDLAIATYESLLAEALHPEQRVALQETLRALKKG